VSAGARWSAVIAPVQARWGALAARERRLVLLAAVVLGLFLLWSLAIRPAWRVVREAPQRLDTLDAQLQSMQRLAAEARELRATAPIAPAQAGAALKAASDRLGDKGRLLLQGERAVLTLSGASGEQLRTWLAEARSGARARPIEVNLTRAPQGFTGTVVVALPSAS